MTERPVFSECVIGYRTWKLDDWVLSPVSYGSPWRPGVNHADCKRGETRNGMFALSFTLGPEPPMIHTPPHQDCTCGIHGYHEIPTEQRDTHRRHRGVGRPSGSLQRVPGAARPDRRPDRRARAG